MKYLGRLSRNIANLLGEEQISEGGYEAGAEDTVRKTISMRRRSRSRTRHAQDIRRKSANGRKIQLNNQMLNNSQEIFQPLKTSQDTNLFKKIPNEFVENKQSSNFKISNLKFECQLAHGSPVHTISGFNSLSDLYKVMADSFDDLKEENILFCTVNTNKINMDQLLSSNVSINDVLYIHIAGQKKEVEILKSETALGLTISDNGIGKAFIKKIKENSIAFKAQPTLQVGDHIECINGESMIGQRHFVVAKYLRSLPIGETFKLRLVEPAQAGFSSIDSRSQPKKTRVVTEGTKTLRFKADGTVIMQQIPCSVIIEKINQLLDTYLGLQDDELALTAWEIASKCSDFIDMQSKIKQSPIAKFVFPEELIYDMWGIVDDWKKERLAKNNSKSPFVPPLIPYSKE